MHQVLPVAATIPRSGFDTRRHGRISRSLSVAIRTAGVKSVAMLLASTPIGLLLGAVEVVTAFVFYLVLVRFGLIPNSDIPSWVPRSIDPAILLLVVAVIAVILRYLTQLLPNLAELAFEARVRLAAADAALNRCGEGSAFSVAEISHLCGTVTRQAGLVQLGLAQSIGAGSALALVVGQLLYLSWQLTVISLGAAVVLGLPLLYLRPVCGRLGDRQYAIHQAFTYRLLKDVRNAHFLKICGLNRYEVAQLDGVLRTAIGYSRANQFLSAASANLPSLAGVVLVLCLLWLNDKYAVMPAATLVPFVYLLNRAIGGLALLSSSTGLFRENLPAMLELAGHVDTLFPAQVDDAPKGGSAPRLASVETRGLVFGREKALTPPLSLGVRTGQMLLIIGASGRGKTTLLMTLIGLVEPLGGWVAWNKVSLDALDHIELRRKIGYAGPEPYLIDADIRSNLLFGLERSNIETRELDQALDLACAEFVHGLDGGLAYQLRENGDGISAGQKQRLALARCLLRRPEVLLLDEATANIDEQTERLMFRRLRVARPDLIILAVSHRSSLRDFADSVLDLDSLP
jgi:ABC-type multidrug transport system fused ATPase/permease subunit